MHSQPPRPLPVVRRGERSNGDGSEAHEGDAVPLMVYAARLGTRDPDALNITRKTASGDGLAFAPSWRILRVALDARAVHDMAARNLAGIDTPTAAAMREAEAARWVEAWATYSEAYVEEMRQSYRENRGAWERLLARERTCLVCYCVDGAKCHRALLGHEILPRLGAVWAWVLDGTKTNARPPK